MHLLFPERENVRVILQICESLYSSITNKMQRYTVVFITINTLHVSGGCILLVILEYINDARSH
jgi:hypothetical protein